MSYDDASSNSDATKASCLIGYVLFSSSVFTRSSYVLPPADLLPDVSPSLIAISISEEDVFLALSSLDPSKSHGIDSLTHSYTTLTLLVLSACKEVYHLS